MTAHLILASALALMQTFAATADCGTAHNGTIVTAGDCSFPSVQQWLSPEQDTPPARIVLKSDPTLCLDYQCDQNPCFVFGKYGPSAFAVKCSDASPKFSVNANKTITVAEANGKSIGEGWCLDLRDGKSNVQVYPCVRSGNQRWSLSNGEITCQGRCTSACVVPVPSYPGDARLHPKIHFTPPYVSMRGGWHDIAGAITHNGVHHVYQGTGWNHAFSTDLVHWQTGPHGPAAIHETYAGMDSTSDPCSGFIAKDDHGTVCAGFRQCGSRKGVAGGAPWDVPLELRCATDNVNLSSWSTDPDYLFNVSWWRAIPYDPARPWREADGNWYQLLSMDGCNTTTRKLPCEAGGQLVMWKSPVLRGPGANWQRVGPVFTSNGTVLSPGGGVRGHLTKEFVTIDFIGHLPGDPAYESETNATSGTRIFLNNVGGNGGGLGCCEGTTSYFPLKQKAPGQAFEQTGPQGMLDWGAFRFASGTDPIGPSGKGIDLLTGVSTRGLSMARTLGSEEADQVSKPGRRVLIGWVGPAHNKVFSGGSAQSLPRELSLNPEQPSQLLQRFVPELQMLRRTHMAPATTSSFVTAGLQAEFVAVFPPSCGGKGMRCGLSVLGDANGTATTITLSADQELVVVDATAQANYNSRAGPLPPSTAKGWTVHAYVDHAIIEVIVNNVTALVVFAAPSDSTGTAALVGVETVSGARLDAWQLASANQI